MEFQSGPPDRYQRELQDPSQSLPDDESRGCATKPGLPRDTSAAAITHCHRCSHTVRGDTRGDTAAGERHGRMLCRSHTHLATRFSGNRASGAEAFQDCLEHHCLSAKHRGGKQEPLLGSESCKRGHGRALCHELLSLSKQGPPKDTRDLLGHSAPWGPAVKMDTHQALG